MGAVLALFALIVLMMIGVPVVYAFAGMTLVLVMVYGIDMSLIMTTGFWSINSVILLALPLFIMTGYVMQAGGMAARLVHFVERIVGNAKHGMGTSMIISCGVFGAISGTASAAVASIGTIMSGPMTRHGYPREYSSALLGVSSLLGLMIPPSITMILYAVVTRQSVAACFLATIGPGLLLIIFLIIRNWFKSKIFEQSNEVLNATEKTPISKSALQAFPALLIPVIILGGIYGGIFTPTEAAAVALIYAIPMSAIIYRELSLKALTESLVAAATTTGVIIIILMFSFVASRIFTMEQVPQQLTDLLLSTFDSEILILLMVNLFLILLGMIMDDVSVVAIASPLLLPVLVNIGIDPVHFAAIIGTSVIIGCNTPPMAPILFLSSRVCEVNTAKVIRPAVDLLITCALPVMLITTYWPDLSLFLPRLLGYM
ncbi:MAG: TRAP transporter large permease [Pseudomonadota bacterium]